MEKQARYLLFLVLLIMMVGSTTAVAQNTGGTLSLNATTESLYIQPGESILVNMDVTDLPVKVNACQAMLGYSSTYFLNPESGLSGGCVAAGGGVWTELIWDSWKDGTGKPGEIDTAIGLDAQGATGTQANATIATITLTAGTTEGETTVIFRADPESDPGLVASTFFSDMTGYPLWPNKVDSQTIIIDGTKPVMGPVTATPSSWTNGNSIELNYSATDPLSGIDYYKITLAGSTFTTSLTTRTLDVSLLPAGSHTVAVTATDKAGNVCLPATTTIYVDKIAPIINITSYPSPNPVTQGTYQIVVQASDSPAGLASAPVVTVTGMTVSAPVQNPTGTFTYTIVVDGQTANGTHTINATVYDNAGNSASDSESFVVDKNQIKGQVQLQMFSGSSRKVTFVATGAEKKTWTQTLSFTGGVANYTLTNVPAGTTGLSAKTAWSLRRKLAMALDGNNQALVNFTGDNLVLGGDVDESNSVNILDYGIMKSNWLSNDLRPDINGDGEVGTVDYSVMKSNWFQVGDPE